MLLSRRSVCGGVIASVAAAPFIGRAWGQTAVKFESNPFSLGVASGDPDATSVVLWTRLAPKPLEPQSGMPQTTVAVDWEVAEDDKFQKIAKRGRAEAKVDEGHSVHVIADGLSPNRPYWYRFLTAGVESRVGRTRTLPALGTTPERYRLAVAGCQRIEQGFFTAWDEIARSDLDLVFFYGDYIYEAAIPAERARDRFGSDLSEKVRARLATIEDYRTRYALYKLDPDLAAAQAAHPFVSTFDDHEVVNSWGGMYLPGKMTQADLLRLRAIGFQAFYENSPVRPALRPRGHEITAYRSFEVGNLLRLAILDTRQYRSLPGCGAPETAPCSQRMAPERTMLGAEQERWLLDLFGRQGPTWTVLGNQVMMMQRLFKSGKEGIVHNDKWDGFAATRQRVLQGAADRKVSGLVVATGDYHRAFAGNLKVDFDRSSSPVVGVELLGPAISSAPPGADLPIKGVQAANPHIRFIDSKRGYLSCDFGKSKCTATFRAVNSVEQRGSPIAAIKTYDIDPRQPALS